MSQFRSFGKCVKVLCLPDTTFARGPEDNSWQELGASRCSGTLSSTSFSLNSSNYSGRSRKGFHRVLSKTFIDSSATQKLPKMREYDADTGRRSRDIEAMKKVARELRIRHTCSGHLVHRQVVGEKIAVTGRAANESVDLVDRESVGNGKFSHWLWWKYFTNTMCVKSPSLRLWVPSLVFFRWCPQHPRIHWFARNSSKSVRYKNFGEFVGADALYGWHRFSCRHEKRKVPFTNVANVVCYVKSLLVLLLLFPRSCNSQQVYL